MGRHVQGVRDPRRDVVVLARGHQGPGRQARVVVSMDDVMSDAGVLRILLEQRLEQRRRFELLLVGLVGRRCGPEQRQRVEHRHLEILRVLVVQILKRITERARPRPMFARTVARLRDRSVARRRRK